jgi:hypothetical protein
VTVRVESFPKVVVHPRSLNLNCHNSVRSVEDVSMRSKLLAITMKFGSEGSTIGSIENCDQSELILPCLG